MNITSRIITVLLVVAALSLVINAALAPRYPAGYDWRAFAELPVQAGGRILPLDSLARNNLRGISGRSSLRLPDGSRMSAIQWLAEVAFRPQQAKHIEVFRIDHDEVLGLFGWEQGSRKLFSLAELEPHFTAIAEQFSQVPQEAQKRTPFERQIVRLHNALDLYFEINYLLQPGDDQLGPPTLQYEIWEQTINNAIETVRKSDQEGTELDANALARMRAFIESYQELARLSRVGITPPRTPEAREEQRWSSLGQTLLDGIRPRTIDPVVMSYARLAEAYIGNQPEVFNTQLTQLRSELSRHAPLDRVAFEEFFNTFAPFYQSIVLYVTAFLLVCLGWLTRERFPLTAAFALIALAFVIHTFGLGARMYIQSRPPVTNLYSSAIFVGWGAVLLGLILERYQRQGFGSAMAAMVGFITLVIAHNLAATGDTLEMMRAVLDSNFWLATHVVIITLGYSAMFLAGFIGIAYILLGVFGKMLDREAGKAMAGAVYGTICFATLFSFVGTMLGGVWADQSWGRFWGWDPKENGALMIVLWCAVILHARWGKLVGPVGLMQLAIVGNIITSWSWFGTNMLGIGLHSYGFMEEAFFWLLVFVASQALVIIIGWMPPHVWRGGKKLGLVAPPSGS